jgi:hypothetical protein
MLLTVLIPSTPNRRENAQELVSFMKEQLGGSYIVSERRVFWDEIPVKLDRHYNKERGVEIYIVEDDKRIVLGKKRQYMYEKLALGLYSVQWDSDDWMDKQFFDQVLNAIKSEPDCVTYEEYCLMDGQERRSNHSLKYDKWQDNFDDFDFCRSPFYKDVIKTEIARSVPFPNIGWGEDEQWSMALRPHLKTEIHIPKQLYRYIYNSTPNEIDRYGK